jgi:hypothetical protein
MVGKGGLPPLMLECHNAAAEPRRVGVLPRARLKSGGLPNPEIIWIECLLRFFMPLYLIRQRPQPKLASDQKLSMAGRRPSS